MNKEVSDLIASRIYQLRVEICQMTQLEFAEAIGAKYQHTISEYEHGVVKPGISKCAAIIGLAKRFGKEVDLNWIRPDLVN